MSASPNQHFTVLYIAVGISSWHTLFVQQLYGVLLLCMYLCILCVFFVCDELISQMELHIFLSFFGVVVAVWSLQLSHLKDT